jgi:transcriptional regulator with XRE-family HTH domain
MTRDDRAKPLARQRLIQRREELGLTRAQVAEALRYDPSAYARLEQGRIMLRVGRRPRLAEILRWSPAQLAIALDGDEVAAPNGHAVPAWLGHLASLEQAAAEIRAFEPIVVHGLMQTADYATAVESIGSYTDQHVAEKVQVRLARQAVLDRTPDPLRLSVVLDESVLLRPAASGSVMVGQLEHLIELGERANVTVQVMPLSAAVFPAAFGAFSLLASGTADEPYMAVTEDGAGPHYLDRRSDISQHVELFGHLSASALSAAESVELIRRTMKEMYL